MVFSSIPAGFYNLHPASNLQQPPLHHNQRTLHHGSSSNIINPNPPPTHPAPHPARPMGGPGSIIRLGSMAEKALLENAPIPKAGLECPRCGSTDTKFCYYNNYSLKQPRHKCRGCRRYWTHNGRIRTIPMGGNRRNKRSKPPSSKSTLRFSSARTPPHSTPAPLRFAGGHGFGGVSAGSLMTNYDYGGINNNYSDDGIGFVGSMVNGPVGEEQWRMNDQLSPVLIFPQFPPFPGAVAATAAGAAGGYDVVCTDKLVAFEDGQIMHGAAEESASYM